MVEVNIDEMVLNSLFVFLGVFLAQLVSNKLAGKLAAVAAYFSLPRLSFFQNLRFILLPIALLILVMGAKISLALDWLQTLPMLVSIIILTVWNWRSLFGNDEND